MDERSFIDIDKDKLDEEWVAQARLVLTYSRKLADAKKAAAEAKLRAKLIEAELDEEIRLAPKEFNLARVSDKAVEMAVKRHARYLKGQQKYIDAEHLVDTLAAAVGALQHKKQGLQDLVILQGREYWPEPRLPDNEEAREALERAGQRAARLRGRNKNGDD